MEFEFELEEEDPAPTADELAACVDVLKRVNRSDLKQPHLAPLLNAGLVLFTREVIKRRFGDGEMVDAVAQLSQQRQTVRELSRHFAANVTTCAFPSPYPGTAVTEVA